jgi:tetratricopeptide (TPR) repeat protein
VIRLVTSVGGLLLLALAGFISQEAPRRSTVEAFELRYFPSGKLLRAASVGFSGVAADLSFLRGVQYYGEHRRSDRQYPWAAHIFDVVVELDPRFVEPYLFGALVVSEDARQIDRGLDLLERGMAENPDRWELPFRAGFIAYVHQKDHLRAARWFEQALACPGAPEYVHKFAAYVYRQGGNKAASLRLWRDLAQTTDDPALREVAERYIREIESGVPEGGDAQTPGPNSDPDHGEADDGVDA